MALQCSVLASTSLPQMAPLLQVLLMSESIEEEGDMMTAQLKQGNLMAAPDAIEKERTCTQDG